MNNLSATVRLGADAELRYSQDGIAVCQFNAALQSGYGKNAKTSWVRCTVWAKKAEAVHPYLKKGSHVAITGEITMSEYQNKAGETKASLECRIVDITLLDKRADDYNMSPTKEPKKADGFQPDPFDNDEPLPF
jgi:single-strand DNA-binding protein